MEHVLFLMVWVLAMAGIAYHSSPPFQITRIIGKVFKHCASVRKGTWEDFRDPEVPFSFHYATLYRIF